MAVIIMVCLTVIRAVMMHKIKTYLLTALRLTCIGVRVYKHFLMLVTLMFTSLLNTDSHI